MGNVTTDRFFPRPVTLTMPDYTQRKFVAGMNPVPNELLDNPYLLNSGMMEYTSGQPLPSPVLPAPFGTPAHSAAILNSGVYDATQAQGNIATDAMVQASGVMVQSAGEAVRAAQENLQRALEVQAGALANHSEVTRRREAASSLDENGSADRDRAERDRAEREKAEQEKVAAEIARKAKYDALSTQDKKKYDAAKNDQERDAILK